MLTAFEFRLPAKSTLPLRVERDGDRVRLITRDQLTSAVGEKGTLSSLAETTAYDPKPNGK